jgi:hypothetical protein
MYTKYNKNGAPLHLHIAYLSGLKKGVNGWSQGSVIWCIDPCFIITALEHFWEITKKPSGRIATKILKSTYLIKNRGSPSFLVLLFCIITAKKSPYSLLASVSILVHHWSFSLYNFHTDCLSRFLFCDWGWWASLTGNIFVLSLTFTNKFYLCLLNSCTCSKVQSLLLEVVLNKYK